MTAKPAQLEMTADQFDALVARALAVQPLLAVVLRAVKAGAIGYCEVLDARTSRVLALRRDLPMLLLVCDQAGLGPAHFGAEFMAGLCRRVCGVTLVVDHEQQPDDLAYVAATEHVVARRQAVLLVETHRQAVRAWVEAAYSAGRDHSEVAVVTADPNQPSGLEKMTLDDFTAKAPPATGKVH